MSKIFLIVIALLGILFWVSFHINKETPKINEIKKTSNESNNNLQEYLNEENLREQTLSSSTDIDVE